MSEDTNDFEWHSVIGFDDILREGGEGRKRKAKRVVAKMKNIEANRSLFVEDGDGLLIHKTQGALWRKSDDGKSIVPVFESDVLSEEDLINQ